jgi:putative Mn2+ efflux pump MntP
MLTLLLLGFVLSLDSFRASLALGAMKLRPMRRVQIILAFGLCDALAPLIGLLIGKSFLQYIGAWTEYLGPVMLCACGAYVIYISQRCADKATLENDHWIVFGLPLSLSLDNLVAGTSLGMLGFPLLLSVTIIGTMSALLSLAGLLLGKSAAKFLKLETELVGGGALVFVGLILAFENL